MQQNLKKTSLRTDNVSQLLNTKAKQQLFKVSLAQYLCFRGRFSFPSGVFDSFLLAIASLFFAVKDALLSLLESSSSSCLQQLLDWKVNVKIFMDTTKFVLFCYGRVHNAVRRASNLALPIP